MINCKKNQYQIIESKSEKERVRFIIRVVLVYKIIKFHKHLLLFVVFFLFSTYILLGRRKQQAREKGDHADRTRSVAHHIPILYPAKMTMMMVLSRNYRAAVKDLFHFVLYSWFYPRQVIKLKLCPHNFKFQESCGCFFRRGRLRVRSSEATTSYFPEYHFYTRNGHRPQQLK